MKLQRLDQRTRMLKETKILDVIFDDESGAASISTNFIENHALQSTPCNMSPSANPNYWMSMLSRQELYNETMR